MKILAALILAAVAATIAEHAHGAPVVVPAAKAAAPAEVAKVATAKPLTRKPVAGELEEIVRTALASSPGKLPKGARVVAVRASSTIEIPLAPTQTTIETSPVPRRAGSVSTHAVLSFWKEADVAARLPVTVDLDVPAAALLADVPKGTALTLVVRRGLVEVTAGAVTSADADVGDVIQVLLRPSGRAMRAQIVARDRAVATEETR